MREAIREAIREAAEVISWSSDGTHRVKPIGGDADDDRRAVAHRRRCHAGDGGVLDAAQTLRH
jgi:hypothetical protein